MLCLFFRSHAHGFHMFAGRVPFPLLLSALSLLLCLGASILAKRLTSHNRARGHTKSVSFFPIRASSRALCLSLFDCSLALCLAMMHLLVDSFCFHLLPRARFPQRARTVHLGSSPFAWRVPWELQKVFFLVLFKWPATALLLLFLSPLLWAKF